MAKLLLVEDEKDIQEMLARRLVKRGHAVVTASDGAEACALAKSEQPDLILMDISLRGSALDGWEATRQIKAAPETRAIPVIALTAHALPEHQARCQEAGCDDYDTKPIDLPRLLEKIQALLSKLGRS